MSTKGTFKGGIASLVLGSAALVFGAPAAAVSITPTLDGSTLVNALLAGGGAGIDTSTVTFSFSGQSSGTNLSAGTYTDGAASYGIAPGMVISSGGVDQFGTSSSIAYGVPATTPQQDLLFPISGQTSHFDVTQLDISFDMLPGFDTVFFNVTFQSTEFPVYVGTQFIDAFGLYVNGTNIAFVDGDPINVDHPYMGTDPFNPGSGGSGVLGSADAGVGSTAIGPFFHTFSSAVSATDNTLTFIISDSGDSSLDSFAFISQLGGTPPSAVPEPGTLALLGLGLTGLAMLRRRKMVV